VISPRNSRSALPAHGHRAAAVLLVICVYTGFESGLVVAGEARNPRRDLPHALLWALFVCSALYVLIQAVSVAALPALASSTSPLVDVAAALMRPWGALRLTAGVIASVGANLVGSMFLGPILQDRCGPICPSTSGGVGGKKGFSSRSCESGSQFLSWFPAERLAMRARNSMCSPLSVSWYNPSSCIAVAYSRQREWAV
jgi:amino acid transporter